KAEQALRESEVRFRTLVEISNQGISIIDRDGRFLYTSPAFARMSGYSQEELQGRTFLHLVPPEDWPQLQADFGTILANPQETFSIGARFLRKDSSVGDVISTGKFLPNDTIVSYAHDVTEQKRAEHALRESDEALRKLNADLECRVVERT